MHTPTAHTSVLAGNCGWANSEENIKTLPILEPHLEEKPETEDKRLVERGEGTGFVPSQKSIYTTDLMYKYISVSSLPQVILCAPQ